MTAGFQDLKFRRLTWILNLVQSGRRVGPDPVSVYVRLGLGTVSGPRPWCGVGIPLVLLDPLLGTAAVWPPLVP